MHDAFPPEDGGNWYRHTILDNDNEPVNQLYEAFVHDRQSTGIRNAASLAKEASLSGRIIWLGGIKEDLWPKWNAFLENYAHACRSVDPFERLLFCVPLIGKISDNAPREDICLSHHKWMNCVDSLDILLYTHQYLRKKRIHEPLKKLAISMIASLAQWDPLIVDNIAFLPIEEIFYPFPVLKKIAKMRKWTPDDLLSPMWHKGQVDYVDGKELIHPALLAICDNVESLDKSIWAAQVGIMLPFVETCRQRLLEILPMALKVPFKTRFGEEITNRKDLEIGHIESQLYRNGQGVSTEIKCLLPKLREIRNRLAHMEPLSVDLVSCREIADAAANLYIGNAKGS